MKVSTYLVSFEPTRLVFTTLQLQWWFTTTLSATLHGSLSTVTTLSGETVHVVMSHSELVGGDKTHQPLLLTCSDRVAGSEGHCLQRPSGMKINVFQ